MTTQRRAGQHRAWAITTQRQAGLHRAWAEMRGWVCELSAEMGGGCKGNGDKAKWRRQTTLTPHVSTLLACQSPFKKLRSSKERSSQLVWLKCALLWMVTRSGTRVPTCCCSTQERPVHGAVAKRDLVWKRGQSSSPPLTLRHAGSTAALLLKPSLKPNLKANENVSIIRCKAEVS